MARFKINRELLPVKAHYFFFFAALGPLLPQMNVYGRQLGISPEVMGLVTAVLPLLWAIAKPCFGYIVDYFTNQRKLIFMLLIAVMSGSYCGMWFLPDPVHSHQNAILETVYHLNGTVYLKHINTTNYSLRTTDKTVSDDTFYSDINSSNIFDDTSYISDKASNISNYIEYSNDALIKAKEIINDLNLPKNNEEEFKRIETKKYNCHWDCSESTHFDIWMTSHKNIEEIFVDKEINNDTCEQYNMEYVISADGLKCKPKENCNLLCIDDEPLSNGTLLDVPESVINNLNVIKNDSIWNVSMRENGTNLYVPLNNTNVTEIKLLQSDSGYSIYGTVTFWGFVILMCIGTVAFNVANCIGDAICFDVLGQERTARYGSQRAWGTAGYGATAFLGGWLVDLASDGAWSNFTPAFVLAAAFTLLDLICCRHLSLPQLTSAEDAAGVLWDVLRRPRVLLFLVFAVVAGMFDSYIIYYMFWYLEELAEETGQAQSIKLLEGIIVFGQSFVGELLFFFLSGRILNRFGHGLTMTFCLFCYGLRMGFISLVTNPWHLVPVEAIMQGPTYALTYSTIVGYAARVAPEGHSATMQGIVAGVDDGLGFALGSLVGGQLYGRAGGRNAFRYMSGLAVLAALMHALLHKTVFNVTPATDAQKAQVRSSDVSTPEEAEKMLESNKHGSVYCDTVTTAQR